MHAVFFNSRFSLGHCLFCLVNGFILRLPCLIIADFKVIHQNRILNGHVFREITSIDDAGCTAKCAREPRCKSYNIHLTSGICQLNDEIAETNGNNLTMNVGWIYKSTDYNQTKV